MLDCLTKYIVFSFFIGLFFYSCNNNLSERKRDIIEKYKVECFSELESKIILKKNDSISLKNVIDCFNWDSLVIQDMGSYKKNLELNYNIIDSLNGKRLTRLDWFEGDKGWYYIYFYLNGKKLEDAIAIPHVILDFTFLRELKMYGKRIDKNDKLLVVKNVGAS